MYQEEGWWRGPSADRLAPLIPTTGMLKNFPPEEAARPGSLGFQWEPVARWTAPDLVSDLSQHGGTQS